MKKIQQEVKTYKDIYVSVDGKEFSNKEDCEAWEKSYKGTIAASWSLIKKVDASTVNLGLPWSSDDYECYVLKPKSLDEITLINAYIQSSTCSSGTMLTTGHIGHTIAINFGYDHDYCDVYVIEDNLKNITNYMAKLENELNDNGEKETE